MESEYEFHDAANIFPLMNKEEFEKLKADIAEHGQKEYTVLFDGKIIDGRNRYRACQELGIECDFSELEECDDPVGYVISANLHRRQLKPSQWAMCAAKMCGLPKGRPKLNTQDCVFISQDDAAVLFNCGKRNIQKAIDVLHTGCTELIRLCELGELTVNAACKLIDMCAGKKDQAKIAKQGAKAVREHVATPKAEPVKRYDKADIELPDEPTDGQVGAVERWLAQQDERPKFEQFKAVWDSADDVGKAAIRAFVLEQ